MHVHVLDTMYFIKELLHSILGNEYGLFVLIKDLGHFVMIYGIVRVIWNLIFNFKSMKEYMRDETFSSNIGLIVEAINQVKYKLKCDLILSIGFALLIIITFKIMIFTIHIAPNVLIV